MLGVEICKMSEVGSHAAAKAWNILERERGVKNQRFETNWTAEAYQHLGDAT